MPWASGSGLADDWDEVTLRVQFLEEGEARFAGLGDVATSSRKTGCENAGDSPVRGARVAGKGDHVGEFRLQEVGPVLRVFLDEVLVHFEGHNAIIVAIPVAFSVLGRIRDRVPGFHLVRLDELFSLCGRAEGEADVDNVRRLRSPCCPCWP